MRIAPPLWPAVAWLFVLPIAAAQPEVADQGERVRRTIEGAVFEFAPPLESLAEALAPRIAALRAEPGIDPPSQREADPATAALTAEHFRQRRDHYLSELARLSGRSTPTAVQTEAYDRILQQAEQLPHWMQTLTEAVQGVVQPQEVTLWDRAELLAALKRGATIPGFKLNEAGDGGEFNWSAPIPPPPRAEPKGPSRLGGNVRFSLERGRYVFSSDLRLLPAPLPATAGESEPAAASTPTLTPYAVVIEESDRAAGTDVLADRIMEKQIRGLYRGLQGFAHSLEHAPIDHGIFAFHLLKETTRLGLLEHLETRPELRWVTEGAARYIAWRLVHEAHSAETAVAVFNLRGLLRGSEAQASAVNLERWRPLPEKPTDEDNRLENAHQAQATLFFFLTEQRAGADAVPRFLSQLTNLSPRRLNARACATAYRRATGLEMKQVLADVRSAATASPPE